MIRIWVSGLVRHRWRRVAAASAGIALAVALIASLGSFLASSTADMSRHASAGVAIDWQVEVRRGPVSAVAAAIAADPHTLAAAPVQFAATPGMSATTQGTTQTTGPGAVLGIPTSWRKDFPLASRLLTGRDDGALIAQQTAANLQVKVGDLVNVQRTGQASYQVRVAGVVELPQADSLFQNVGAPAQSQPNAPPDNVLLLPSATFAQAYHRSSDGVRTQIHVRRKHDLPADPTAAYSSETGAVRNLELRTAGAGVVGDNLGTVLGAAREDAAYARVLFLFLGMPGVVLAGLLTAAIIGSDADRRRREQALLRARGCSTRQLWRFVAAETGLIAAVGALFGLGVASVAGAVLFGSAGFGATFTLSLAWGAGAAAAGVLIAILATVPAGRELRRPARVGSARPRWLGFGLDLLLLAVAAALYAAAGRSKYQLVLAPEGVPTISVSYWALLAPALAWIGASLLIWRLADLMLGPGRSALRWLLRPMSGHLAGTAVSMLSRQRRLTTRSVVLLAMALSFAISTATFAATYQQQAEVDAQLTSGADVTVTEPPGANTSPAFAQTLQHVPGVAAVEPMLHRFAYVGADLQDLYGVNPRTIQNATTLQDPYFQGASAKEMLHRLDATPDGALVSAETVNDFQLSPGDPLHLRLQDGDTGRYTAVTFRYVGIVNEFPTAPKDSFIVANSAYVTQQTKSSAVGTFLIRAGGTPAATAARLRTSVGPSAQISTIDQARGLVSSSLTSIDVSGLTRLELTFAILIAAASGGLVIGLSLNERRRTVAVLIALGARPRQLSQLNRAEPAWVIAAGTAAGILAGWGMSHLLVTMLAGVFDPPPSTLAYPWLYLLAVVVTAAVAIAAASSVVFRRARSHAREALREA